MMSEKDTELIIYRSKKCQKKIQNSSFIIQVLEMKINVICSVDRNEKQ